MAKIDIDKFVASIMKCLWNPHREDAYMCRHWINKALDAQGLKFENGEIVKSQRTIVAEAKEAIFDNEDERIKQAIICVFTGESNYTSKEDANKYIAWLKKREYTQRDVDDAYLKGVTDTKNELEKQGEQILANSAKTCKSERDAEKKELKKIHVIDEGKDEMDYCFTKMMNGEKVSPTWSEEDEKMSENILSHLRQYYVQKKGYPYVADLNSPEMKEFNWLKSLKQRLGGK